MVMIDIHKAFDNVDHQFAFIKHQFIGVSSIKRFESHLTGRKQLIDVHGGKFNLSDVEYHRRVFL